LIRLVWSRCRFGRDLPAAGFAQYRQSAIVKWREMAAPRRLEFALCQNARRADLKAIDRDVM